MVVKQVLFERELPNGVVIRLVQRGASMSPPPRKFIAEYSFWGKEDFPQEELKRAA